MKRDLDPGALALCPSPRLDNPPVVVALTEHAGIADRAQATQ